MRANETLCALLVVTALVYGCGGNTAPPTGQAPAGATATTDAPATPTPTSQVPAPTPTGVASAGELPSFMSEFDRVCETQVGYAGAARYDPTPGLHPVILFTDHGEPPTLIQSSATLPAGWTVTEDMDFTDNSELAGVQLVACSRRTQATPNGTMCDFELNDGDETVTLELVDTVYALSVYAATTGEQIGETQTIEAATTECPFFASFREGDTQFLNYPTADQYVNALKEFVAPD